MKWFIGGAFVLLVFWAILRDNSPAGVKIVKPEATAAPAKEQPVAEQAPNWTYSTSTDEITQGIVTEALVQSVNEVNFSFPYQGAQRATLQLRKHPRWGKDVILSIERGQFLCFQHCKVTIRFDDGKGWEYPFASPADHSTTSIFIRGYADIVATLKKSRRIWIEAPFYQQGAPVFEFDVSGLKW